jgi:hypothetical protein
MSLVAGVRKHAIIALAVALWIPAVGYGINTLWRYSITAGHPAGDSGEAERTFRREAERHSGMIPNTIGA